MGIISVFSGYRSCFLICDRAQALSAAMWVHLFFRVAAIAVSSALLIVLFRSTPPECTYRLVFVEDV